MKNTIVKEIGEKLFIICNDKDKPVKGFGFLQSDESYAADLKEWEEWETQYEVAPEHITHFQVIAMKAWEVDGNDDNDFAGRLKEGIKIPNNRVKIVDGHKCSSGEIKPMAFANPIARGESVYHYQTDWELMTKKDLRLLWEQIQQLNLSVGLSQSTLDDCANAIQKAIDKIEE